MAQKKSENCIELLSILLHLRFIKSKTMSKSDNWGDISLLRDLNYFCLEINEALQAEGCFMQPI